MAAVAAATPATDLGGGPGSATYGSVLPAVTDYSILVVVGALRPGGLLERLLQQIDAGVRCWSVDLDASVLDQQLKLFVSRHSAFLSEDVPGQRTLRHSGDVLDTQVVLSPGLDLVCSEVQQLLSSPSRHKLLILAGQFVEDSGDLVLQKGQFSPNHLLHIFREEEVKASTSGRPAAASSLTLSCPDYGLWKDSGLREKLHSSASVHINPPPSLPQMEGLHEFTEYLSESLEPDSPFHLLEPPSTVGFLKLSRPCCYIFPGGRGDAAFFAVNGFNLLVNGGSDPRSCFWKLVRHLDRIDAVLLTHVGVDNLPGLNSLLLRKSAELELPAGAHAEQEQLKQLVSPEVGVVFLNAPESLAGGREEPRGQAGGREEPRGQAGGQAGGREEPSLLRSRDELALTLQHLQRLQIQPQGLRARPGPGLQPLILFQKMGVGRLELYVLHPVSGSRGLEAFLQLWPNASGPAGLPPPCLASVCALLVWHPFSPQEKIIRALFPGCTPQPGVLEGLQKVSRLPFLQQPLVCSKDLEAARSEKQAGKTESSESLPRPGRREELLPPEPKKKEGKPKPKGTSETAAKEKKDGSEKPKVKETDAKSKLMKPVRRSVPKKDGPKEDKREAKDDKTCAAAEVKKEEAGDKKQDAPGPKPKRDPKAEAKKDGRREVKTDGGKGTRAGTKDGKKAAGSLGGGSELRKAGGTTLKRDATLPKKAAPKSQKEAPPLRRAAPQAPRPQPEPEPSRSPEKVEKVEVGQQVGGAPASASTTEAAAAPVPDGGEAGGPAGARTLHLNGHLCPRAASPRTASCNGVGVGVGVGVDVGVGVGVDVGVGVGVDVGVHELAELGSAAPHDVDLCLVSPCEFQHPRTPESPQHHAGTPAGASSPPPSEGPGRRPSGPGSDPDLLSPDRRSSDPDPPLSPSPSAPPPEQSPPPARSGVQLSSDPPPAPIKDLPPLPAQPGACMADAESKNLKTSAAKSRKPAGPALKVGSAGSGRSKVGSWGSSTLSTQASSRAAPSDSGAAEVYVDLAYLPSGAAASTLDADFFRHLRSLHYVISGDDEVKAAAMRSILDALLEGKASWPEVEVTLIPTFDSLPMHDWYQDAHERLGQLQITVLGSNSTVAMQEETFPACKVEF